MPDPEQSHSASRNPVYQDRANESFIPQAQPDLDVSMRKIREIENKIQRIMPHIFTREKTDAGTQNFELVTLTSDGGSGGDESTPCDFTYAFTLSDSSTFDHVSPVTNRLPTALAAKRGIWDIDNEELSAIDEWPDGGPCT